MTESVVSNVQGGLLANNQHSQSTPMNWTSIEILKLRKKTLHGNVRLLPCTYKVHMQDYLTFG